MTWAVILGLLVLVASIVLFISAFRFGKYTDERMAVYMVAITVFTVSVALFGVGTFPDERRTQAVKCFEEGYEVVLDDHEIYGDTIIENIDKYVVLEIDNDDRIIYVKSTYYSPVRF